MLIKTDPTVVVSDCYADEVNADIERFLKFLPEHQKIILQRAEELYQITKKWAISIGIWEDTEGLIMNEELDNQIYNHLGSLYHIYNDKSHIHMKNSQALIYSIIEIVRMSTPNIYLPKTQRSTDSFCNSLRPYYIQKDLCVVLKGYDVSNVRNPKFLENVFHTNLQGEESLLDSGESIPQRRKIGNIVKDSLPIQTTDASLIYEMKKKKVEGKQCPAFTSSQLVTGLSYGTNNDNIRFLKSYDNVRPATFSEIVAMLVARNDFPPPRNVTVSVLPPVEYIPSLVNNQQVTTPSPVATYVSSSVIAPSHTLSPSVSPSPLIPTSSSSVSSSIIHKTISISSPNTNLPDKLKPVTNNNNSGTIDMSSRSIELTRDETLYWRINTIENDLPIITPKIRKSFEDGDLNLEKSFGENKDLCLLALLKPYEILYHSAKEEFISKGRIDIDLLINKIVNFYYEVVFQSSSRSMVSRIMNMLVSLLANSTNILNSDFISIILDYDNTNRYKILDFLLKIYPIEELFDKLTFKYGYNLPIPSMGVMSVIRDYLTSLKIYSVNEVNKIVSRIKIEQCNNITDKRLYSYKNNIRPCDQFNNKYISYYNKIFEEMLLDNQTLINEEDSQRLYIAYNKFLNLRKYQTPNILRYEAIEDFIPIMLLMLEDPTLDFQEIYDSNYL